MIDNRPRQFSPDSFLPPESFYLDCQSAIDPSQQHERIMKRAGEYLARSAVLLMLSNLGSTLGAMAVVQAACEHTPYVPAAICEVQDKVQDNIDASMRDFFRRQVLPRFDEIG